MRGCVLRKKERMRKKGRVDVASPCLRGCVWPHLRRVYELRCDVVPRRRDRVRREGGAEAMVKRRYKVASEGGTSERQKQQAADIKPLLIRY
jgi:hypothetical protein